MITVQRDVRPEEIRQSRRHVLFVEGKKDSAIDADCIRELLHDSVRVEPLGPSSNIRAAADAMHEHHPDYYFLIDRDHYDDSFVEQCWREFPDPKTSNLLVWRRRELENYFLIPEYLERSQYLTATPAKLRRVILESCRKRLYFDAANLVVIWIREELKAAWIELFPRAERLQTKNMALAKLLARPELPLKVKGTSKILSEKSVTNRFQRIVKELTGGRRTLDYGIGRWLELLKGKGVLPTIVNQCFRVKDARGKPLQGKERLSEVVKDLVRRPIEEQPDDFRRLIEIIQKRVGVTPGRMGGQ